MTLPSPDIPQHSDYESKEFYLKEALRLSELRIEYQHRISAILERKAVLLTSLCLVIIGYLLSLDLLSLEVIWDKKGLIMVIQFIILIIILYVLGIAALKGSFVLEIRPFESPGDTPNNFMREAIKYNFKKMADDLLEDYNKRYISNEAILKEKENNFKKSWKWGKWGIVFALPVIIINNFLGEMITNSLNNLS